MSGEVLQKAVGTLERGAAPALQLQWRLDKTSCSQPLSLKRKKKVQFGRAWQLDPGRWEACGVCLPRQGGDSAPPTDPRACGWEPPVPATGPPRAPRAWSGAGVGCRRGPQAARRTRDGEPGVRGRAGNASSGRLGPARSISRTARRAQAGHHSPKEQARAEVGVLQRVGFHLGVHGQHLAPGTRGLAGTAVAVVAVCAAPGGAPG